MGHEAKPLRQEVLDLQSEAWSRVLSENVGGVLKKIRWFVFFEKNIDKTSRISLCYLSSSFKYVKTVVYRSRTRFKGLQRLLLVFFTLWFFPGAKYAKPTSIFRKRKQQDVDSLASVE